MPKNVTTIRQMMKTPFMGGTINTSSFNVDTNEIEVVFATESLVIEKLPNGERFYEQVEISNAAADLQRINNNGAVLDNHQDESITSQIGVVVRAWIDEATKEAKAILRLSKSDKWKDTVKDISDGIIKNISFRFARKKMIDTGNEKDGIRILKTVSWEAQEVSFVTIPADYTAGVRNRTEENEVIIQTFNNNNMLTEAQKKARKEAIEGVCRALKLEDSFAQTLIDDETITEEVARGKAIAEVTRIANPTPPPASTKAERERLLEITQTCRKFKLDSLVDDKGVNFMDSLIAGTESIDAVRKSIIDKVAEMQDKELNGLGGPAPVVVGDEKRIAARALAKEHAILQRAGIQLKDEDGKDVKYAPDVYRGMSLKDIAFECLVERGVNPRTTNLRELKRMCLDPEYAVRSAGSLTTSDFPSITENVLNKVALQRYQLAERTWEPLVKKRTAKDFKPFSNVRLNDVFIDETSEILEGGEYTQIKMTDGKESYRVYKFGKKLILSWEALINDDLSMFNDAVANVVDGFTQFHNRAFYQVLTSATSVFKGANKMSDGKYIFHADHNNLIGTGTTINIDSLTAMRLLLRSQTSPSGNKLNLNPKFLIVGPALETLAEQFTSSNYVATEQGKINKLGGSLTPIVDANISGNQWFLSATPSAIPTIEVANLEGQELFTESRYSFDVDGMETKIRNTYGIKAIDFRGMVKNPGA